MRPLFICLNSGSASGARESGFGVESVGRGLRGGGGWTTGQAPYVPAPPPSKPHRRPGFRPGEAVGVLGPVCYRTRPGESPQLWVPLDSSCILIALPPAHGLVGPGHLGWGDRTTRPHSRLEAGRTRPGHRPTPPQKRGRKALSDAPGSRRTLSLGREAPEERGQAPSHGI